ncbi:hypothetical protein BDN72DRAFT_933192 [Pluteus cervinus]|uniref:Uncharacterized protein n=1 Tax=Pluteus cervinus TaxID=181527 RepID=A0ACD3A8W5_9AGAR|nr:hypothetical protein BDN72DRAFT_933192 [Pluteus cervinus]
MEGDADMVAGCVKIQTIADELRQTRENETMVIKDEKRYAYTECGTLARNEVVKKVGEFATRQRRGCCRRGGCKRVVSTLALMRGWTEVKIEEVVGVKEGKWNCGGNGKSKLEPSSCDQDPAPGPSPNVLTAQIQSERSAGIVTGGRIRRSIFSFCFFRLVVS